MKVKFIVIITLAICFSMQSYSQNLNWENLKPEQEHVVNINIGWDYGLVFGAGYGYKLKTKMPVVLQASQSFPSGKNIFDDFKTKVGAQIRLYKLNHIQLSTSINGVYRRYQNPLVSLSNFGSDVSVTAGYYRSRYFVAGEAGFDKAIVTHFKHSNSFKDVYPKVRDGWYEPATGGNFQYGLKTGFSTKNSDVTLRFGKVITQDFKTTPLIPFYAGFGYALKFK